MEMEVTDLGRGEGGHSFEFKPFDTGTPFLSITIEQGEVADLTELLGVFASDDMRRLGSVEYLPLPDGKFGVRLKFSSGRRIVSLFRRYDAESAPVIFSLNDICADFCEVLAIDDMASEA